MHTAEIIHLEMRGHRVNGAPTRGSGPMSLDEALSAAISAIRDLQLAATLDGALHTSIKADCCIAMLESS